MSAITSGDLAAALNERVVDAAFTTVRTQRNGLLGLVGFDNPQRPTEGKKLEWLDSRIDADQSPLTAGVSDSATTIPVTDGSIYRVGTTVSTKVSDEVLLVTAVNGNNLTVTRGFGGTTAAPIDNGSALFVDSTSREENSLAETDGIKQPFDNENFFQTMDTALEFSRRSMATMQYGNTNDMQYQVSERLRQLATQLERAMINGRKAEVTIGGKNRTYTGGLKYYMDQADAMKVDANAAALTLGLINDLNQEIVTRGGTTNTLMCGISLARKLNEIVSANYSSQRLSDFISDEGALIRLPSDLPLIGNVNNIVIDTNMRDNELMLLDSSQLSIVPMGAGNGSAGGSWRTLDATQPGQDGAVIRVIGDFAMKIRNSQTHMAWMNNIG